MNAIFAMKFVTISSVILAITTIAGCTVGPDYHSPQVNVNGHWSETLSGGETDKSEDIAQWWRRFDDRELDSLVRRAIASNLDVTIATARVRESRAELGVTKADLWPSADLEGSYARQRQSQNQPIIGAIPLPGNVPFETDLYEASFDSSWELDIFGGKRRAVEAGAANLAAAQFNLQDAQVTLVSEVARNYIQFRSDQRRLQIAHENIQAQRHSVEIARDRFRNGFVSDLDAEQAATVLAQTEAEVPTLESDREASIHAIEILLGRQPGSLHAELTDAAPIPALPPSVPIGLPADLLRRRPDIRAAERQLAAATANIGVATADLFPKLSLTGDFGWESVSAADWFSGGSRYWSIGPAAQWHIFDAGRIFSNIKVRNARQEQALATYQKTVLNGLEEVENALVKYSKEQLRNRSLREAAASGEKSTRISREQYGQGITSFINVLDAERSLYQAQDQVVISDQAVAQNMITVYKALGGGWSGPGAVHH